MYCVGNVGRVSYLDNILQQVRSFENILDGRVLNSCTVEGCGMHALELKFVTLSPLLLLVRLIATPSCPGLNIPRQSSSTLCKKMAYCLLN